MVLVLWDAHAHYPAHILNTLCITKNRKSQNNLWCMWCVRLRSITQHSCFQSCTAHSQWVLDNRHEPTRVHVSWVLRLQVSSSLCTCTKSPVLQMWISRVQMHRVLGCRLECHTVNVPLVVGIYLSFSHAVMLHVCYNTALNPTLSTQNYLFGLPAWNHQSNYTVSAKILVWVSHNPFNLVLSYSY